jgi:hypothetical protein
LGAFVSVLGFVRVVVFASARYVPMLFLLIWHSSAPALISKKKSGCHYSSLL